MPHARSAPLLCAGALALALSGCDMDMPPGVSIEAPPRVLVAAPFHLLVTAEDDHQVNRVIVAWGDGVQDTVFPRGPRADLELSHSYAMAGSFTIQVTATDGSGQAGQSSVPILAAPAGVTISPHEEALHEVGATRTFTATVVDAVGAAVPNPETSWRSLEPGVATVSSQGVVTAVGSGTARVVAGSWDVADTATVVVDLPPALQLAGAPRAIVAGSYALDIAVQDDHVVATVTVDWGDGGEAVTISVDSPSVELGLSHSYALAGPHTVRVSVTDGAGLATAAEHEVLVTPAGVTIVPGDTINALGFTRQLAAAVLDADGAPVANPATEWSSLDPGIASVIDGGVATSVAVGSARIVATSWEVSDTIHLPVRQVPAHIAFAAAPDTLFVRGRGTATAEVRDSNQVRIPELAPPLSSATPDLLEVDAAGVLIGVGEGAATLAAAHGDLTVTTSVEVALGLLFSAYEGDSNDDLYVVTRHGTKRRNLTQHEAGDMGGSWSPDGQRIAFLSTRVPGGTILFMDADGGDVTEVETGLGVAHGMVWSPTGDRIAFAGRSHPFYDDIHIIDVDGTGLFTVVADTTVNDVAPAWSPDGARIAFSRTAGSELGIYVVEVSGSGLTRVRASGYSPVWSPDGTEIAFVDDEQIQRMNGDGSNVRVVAEIAVTAIDWSRDGLWLAFAATVEGQRDIFIVSADGGPIVRVTDDAAFEQDVRWR